MRIILIGFMGVGKTSVGRLLSKKLEFDFIDMDLEIEKSQKLSISEIFNIYSESYFRNLEKNLLKDLLKKDNLVISTGGGVVASKENIEILKGEENVIFLDAREETIIKNVSNDSNKRPLLEKDLESSIHKLLKYRYENYIKCCNYIVNVDFKNIEDIVKIIESEVL